MEYKVGQHVTVKINGVPQEATIRAVAWYSAEGITRIVDFGHEQTAMMDERDIARTIRLIGFRVNRDDEFFNEIRYSSMG